MPTEAEALWTATERLRALEEAAPVGIVALDLEGRVTIWNRAAEEMFGWQASEVMGRPSPLCPTEFLEENRALTARVEAGEVISGIDTCRLRRNGSQLSVSLSCAPIRNAEGHVCGHVRVLTDISDARRLAKEFQQAQKMEAFGQLAGGIAHDFNNLITVIIGFSVLALERVRNQPDLQGDLEEINKAGERASRLTRQLLAFSRKQIRVVQRLDLHVLMGQFESMVRRVVREDIRLQIVTVPSLDHINADPGQVEQVVMNLIVNARDAMPDTGTITVATANAMLDAAFAEAHAGTAAGPHVALSVRDTGSGMTEDVLAQAFEPFFTTKGPGKGTGLGLSTVFGLMEQNGGAITIESAPGKGTLVTTYWPAAPAASALLDAPPAEPAEPAVPVALSLRGKETVLLVEDEAGLRRLVERILKRSGYTVLSAEDAGAAINLEASYTRKIDLLLTDMIMPGMNGAALAQLLTGRRPEIEVLFISGYASREVVDLGMTDEHAGFLAKPFTPDVLARKVREHLDRRRNTQRERTSNAAR